MDIGEVTLNYIYAGGHNITFVCDGEPEGELCGVVNENVDVDLERGTATAYSDYNTLYGRYECEVCGHEHDYQVSLGE